MVRFIGERGGDFTGDFALDDVCLREKPTCPDPTALNVSNIMPNSADVSWTDNAGTSTWIVEYGASGFTPGSGMIVSTGSNPYALMGLMERTSYDVYVKALCGIGDTSAAVGPFTFATGCSNMPIANPDYCQGFELFALGQVNGIEQDCWINTNTENPEWVVEDLTTVSGSTGPTGPNSGSRYIHLEASSPAAQGESDTLTGPIIDVSGLASPELSFFYHMYGQSMGDLLWEFSNDGGSSWTTIGQLIGEQQTASTDPWLESVTDISGFGNSVQIRFVGIRSSDFYSDMAIDDICIREMPTCPAPTALAINNITGFTADLSWTENAGASSWAVEYGVAGFMQGSGTTVLAGSNPYTISGLTPATNYEVYVRSICAIGDSSDWSGPISFITDVSCPAPTALAINNIGPMQVDMSWMENAGATSWEIEYGADGFTLGNGMSMVVGTNPYSIIGLTPESDYDAYVRSICGAGDTSTWSGPISFQTACAIRSVPYLYGFPSFPSDCWYEESGSSTFDWTTDDFGNDLANPYGKAVKLNIWSTENDTLFSPSFDLGAGTRYFVKYDVAFTTFGSTNQGTFGPDDQVHLWVSTDNGASWTVLKSYGAGSEPLAAGQTDSVDLISYSGVVRFAFHGDAGPIDDSNDNDFFVDNFEIYEAPIAPCGPGNITGTPASGTYKSLAITSDALIESPKSVIYKAENDIDLNNNFEVELGAEFETMQEDCP